MVTVRTTTTIGGLSGLLRALILVMLLALAVPAFAMADDAPATVLDPPVADTTNADTTGAVTPDPGTYSETTPPVVDETPVVEPEPTAPPATTTPDPVAEAPTETEIVPTPAPVSPPDVVVTTPELVTTPAVGPDDASAKLLPVVVVPPVSADTVPARVGDVVASVPAGISAATALSSSLTLSAGTDTPVGPVAAAPATEPAGPSASAISGLLTRDAALHQNLVTLDPHFARAPLAAVATTPIPQGLGRLGDEGTSALFSEAVEAPIGAVTSGSSLLAVLAGYVLPGVAGPPASTIIMFVLVGLIVAIARAPRPQLSERAFAGVLVGAASGHGQGVQRPG